MLFVTDAQLELARSDRDSYPRKQIRYALLQTCRRRRLVATPDKLLGLTRQRNHFVWDAFLNELSVAHAVTGNPKFLDHALAFVRTLPDHWRTVPRDADLFVPLVLTGLARFYDLERDHLSLRDAATIRSMMGEMAEWLWAELPIRDYGMRERAAWNHSVIAHSSIGVAGLVLDEHPDAAAWLQRGLERTRLFFDLGVSRAGLTFEGLHYCGYVFKTIGLLLNGMRNRGRIDELAAEGSEVEAKLRRVPTWYAHEMWPKGSWLQNYNDSHWDPHSPLFGFLLAFSHYDPEMCAVVWDRLVGQEGRGTWGFHKRWSSLADSLLFFPGCQPDRGALERLDHQLFCPDVGYVSARDGWGDDASVFTFNSGRVPCELHDQADNNSFTFIARGEPIVIDSGASNRLNETSASSALGHNVVFIDDRGQHPAGQGTCVDGRILGVECTDTHVAVVGDATDSYAAGKYNSAGRYVTDRYNTVRHALRHVVFVKQPIPYLVVYDDIQKDRDTHTYESLLHVPAVDPASPPGHSGSLTVTAEQGPAGLITYLQPDAVVATVQQFIGTELPEPTGPFVEHPLWRCATRAVNPHFVALLVPAGQSDDVQAAVQHDRDRITVRLRWPHGTDELVFTPMARKGTPDQIPLPSFTRDEQAVAASRNGQARRGVAESVTQPPFPTFLIIGAQKSATRWLRLTLGQHPDVYTVPDEIMYFSNPKLVTEEGPSWYRAQFAGWDGQPIVGECTPSYMAWPRRHRRVPEQIKQLLPDVQLIAILRNPVDRAYSAMVHHVREGRLPADTNIVEFVATTPSETDRWGIVGSGWYAANLAPFQRYFGEQLLVLLHDDLCDDPRALFERSLLHIGATPGFEPPSLNEIVYSNQRSGGGTASKRGLPLEQRRQLFELFRDDIRKLETMIDRDLSIWEPDRSTPVPKAR